MEAFATPITIKEKLPVNNQVIHNIEEVLDTNPKTDGEIPVSLYEGRNNKPYLVEVMNLNNNIYKSDQGLKEKIDTINKYVLEQIDLNEFEATKENYKDIYQQLMKMTGASDRQDYVAIINRIFTSLSSKTFANKNKASKLIKLALNKIKS